MHFLLNLQYRTARRLRLAAHPENTCFSNEERVCTINKQTIVLNKNFSSIVFLYILQELFSRISQVLQQKAVSLQDLSSVQESSSCSSIDTKKIQTCTWYIHIGVMMSDVKDVCGTSWSVGKIIFLSSEEVGKRSFIVSTLGLLQKSKTVFCY